MIYRIKLSGKSKFEKWIKTDKSVEKIKNLISHPKIQEVEWKEE